MFTSDTLMAFGVYNFKLTACGHRGDGEESCSYTEISLMAAQSTVMCNVAVESYVELQLVGCVQSDNSSIPS